MLTKNNNWNIRTDLGETGAYFILILLAFAAIFLIYRMAPLIHNDFKCHRTCASKGMVVSSAKENSCYCIKPTPREPFGVRMY